MLILTAFSHCFQTRPRPAARAPAHKAPAPVAAKKKRGGMADESPAFFKFFEGYTNAVRRPVKMRDLLMQ